MKLELIKFFTNKPNGGINHPNSWWLRVESSNNVNIRQKKIEFLEVIIVYYYGFDQDISALWPTDSPAQERTNSTWVVYQSSKLPFGPVDKLIKHFRVH